MLGSTVVQLVDIIKDLLYGPSGDPMDENLRSSVIILDILDKEQHISDIDKEDLEEFVRILSPDGNVYNEDYISEFHLCHLKSSDV